MNQNGKLFFSHESENKIQQQREKKYKTSRKKGKKKWNEMNVQLRRRVENM